MSEVVIRRLEKRYDQYHAIKPLDFDIASGELVAFLGPSGCGKTTTLRMIAGLEIPDAGRIEIGGRVMNDVAAGVCVPPESRGVGMVFQSYAVWPHMTVARNIDYPLRIKKILREERERKLESILELTRLKGQESKHPHQLSGGQQQRVALARGLIMEPQALLLDEPLSNLDAKLRKAMRSEIRDIQKKLGMTMLYVTHDKEEAEAIADRLAIMIEGRLAQVGTPDEIRNRPADDAVKTFWSD